MIMAGKWKVFDGTFNDDGASASSSSIWMIGMVDSIAGDSKIVFVHKMSLGHEHDVYVAHRKKCFRLFCVLMKSVGVPERKLKESSHYVSFVNTVERRRIMVPHLFKKACHNGFGVRDTIELLRKKV
jgi:hypothetical protein